MRLQLVSSLVLSRLSSEHGGESIVGPMASGMDDLKDLYGHLALTEEEEVVVVNPKVCDNEVIRKGELSLIGRICCDRVVGREVV